MNDLIPTRPVLRWHGGKWRLAPWIIGHFAPHQVYVEPFAGAASVLLRKPRVSAECLNDLDDKIVNVFRVLRDRDKALELQRRIDLTPFARSEFEWSYGDPEDDVDAAHRTIVVSFMGHGSDSASRSCRTGFRAKLTDARALPSQAWGKWPNSIPEFTDRLRGVLIEHRDATEVMQRLDGISTLHYVDPPYMPHLRSSLSNGRANTHGYRHELTGGGHSALLATLQGLVGMVVLSGYPDPSYDAALSDWVRVETKTLADGARPRTEVLWINPAAAAALDAQRAPLFASLNAC